MCGGVHDVITGNKFHQNRSRGFRATGVRKLGSHIDLACRPYNNSALPCWLWHGHLAHQSPQLTPHLDRFSRFCTAHYCDRQTDRDRQTDICNNRPRIYVRSTAIRPKNRSVISARTRVISLLANSVYNSVHFFIFCTNLSTVSKIRSIKQVSFNIFRQLETVETSSTSAFMITNWTNLR